MRQNMNMCSRDEEERDLELSGKSETTTRNSLCIIPSDTSVFRPPLVSLFRAALKSSLFFISAPHLYGLGLRIIHVQCNFSKWTADRPVHLQSSSENENYGKWIFLNSIKVRFETISSTFNFDLPHRGFSLYYLNRTKKTQYKVINIF